MVEIVNPGIVGPHSLSRGPLKFCLLQRLAPSFDMLSRGNLSAGAPDDFCTNVFAVDPCSSGDTHDSSSLGHIWVCPRTWPARMHTAESAWRTC